MAANTATRGGRRGVRLARNLLSVLALALCGCGPGGRGAAPAPRPAVGGLSWTVPERWRERPPAGLRAAAYEVPDAAGGPPAACSVFYFGPGRPGTIEANLGRWRSEFGRVESEQRATRDVGGLSAEVVEISGTLASPAPGAEPGAAAQLLGAALPGPHGPVFVKCLGPQAALERSRAEFAALVGSFTRD